MKNSNWVYSLLISGLLLSFLSCRTIPEKAVAVKSFDKAKYLGKWYEIARLDFKYEKDLNNTTAEYSLNENGTIKVNNQGFDTISKQWEQSIGKAKFVDEDDVAMLKVSFFGPFYSGYNVIAIDEDYNYALIAGKSLDYLWLLSRETKIPESIKTKYLKMAEDVGYNTSELLWIEHDRKQ
ncbi:lipocalin family protein [Tamlana sp. 2_MG-2023]|uniref:lipocalin family protein n=1 Tax=unclassified Tamlana TaxID=2614803 RepID=UPI0026E2FF5E|nr:MULTISPECIES: lipocalin family protein [unclassified Tamlana]MDO6761427.1 lipocalin family protein [Tamlana sp. 2_MG-2023]MDO6792129.1 lipocalin family protein [Tamlana sp. 1_MG-2023]